MIFGMALPDTSDWYLGYFLTYYLKKDGIIFSANKKVKWYEVRWVS